MLLGVAWLEHHLGDSGLYLASMLSGIVDLDAIALSLLHRQAEGGVDSLTVARCLAAAYAASLLAKSLLALALGGRSLARALLAPFGLIVLGLLLGLAMP